MAGDGQREVVVPALSPATLVIDGLKAARIYEFQAGSSSFQWKLGTFFFRDRYRSG